MKKKKVKKIEKCSKCRKEIKQGIPTGTLRMVEKLEKGSRIVSSKKVCINCSGEKLIKSEEK